MEFKRECYFSQTEACKLYKLSPKKFKKLIEGHETVNVPITLHGLDGSPYEVTTIYIKKLTFIKIMININI